LTRYLPSGPRWVWKDSRVSDLIDVTIEDKVGVIRLDNPPANALARQVSEALRRAVAQLSSEAAVGAVVVWGGPKLFAAGADIKEMAGCGPDEARAQVTPLAEALDAIEAMPKIAIAAITGYALGGGFELALACDLRYAAADSRLGQPEIRIGVIPGAGGTQRITRLAGEGVARDLCYTGRQIDAEEARRLCLVERVHAADEVFDRAMQDARAFADGPRDALAAAKAAITSSRQPGRSGHDRERDLFVELFAGHDQKEGMAAFLDKREPRFGH
jgi:enoyl-CoA hydratase/carnithine racemase